MTPFKIRREQIIELRCGEEELSLSETAERLGISIHTVKTHCTTTIKNYRVRSFYGVCTRYGRRGADPEWVPAFRVDEI